MNIYALIYFIAINTYGFIIMGNDKWKAVHKRWRVPERTIFIISLLGGAIGIYIGMKVFHHKTLHDKFRFGIPVIIIFNIILLGYIL